MLYQANIISWLYLAVPVAAVVVGVRRARRGPSEDLIRGMCGAAIAGTACAMALIALYPHGAGHISFIQVTIACYWGIATGLVLFAFNALLTRVLDWLVPRGADKKPLVAAQIIAMVIRALVLLVVGIGYVGAMGLTYHPHVVYPGTPASLLNAEYQDVSFAATDGLLLRGWWIPAPVPAPDEVDAPGPLWGKRTVILCHGYNVDKAADLRLARDLLPDGYNVLAFDFRGHGQSSGQFTTFGDLERRDVLGAVRWLQENHPAESQKIFGLGQSTGAAALIAAAGDLSPEGQSIDAIALFAPYDSLTSLIQDWADSNKISRAGWIARRLALPLAGAQWGTSLQNFDPAREAEKIAPRALLVIASEQDQQIAISSAQAVFEQASQPKCAFWLVKSSRQAMLFRNENASRAVRLFFETARKIL